MKAQKLKFSFDKTKPNFVLTFSLIFNSISVLLGWNSSWNQLILKPISFQTHNYSWQVAISTFNIKFQKDFSHSFINESFVLKLIIFNWIYRRWLFHIDNNFWDSELQNTNFNLISLYICSTHSFKAPVLFQKLHILIYKNRKIITHTH